MTQSSRTETLWRERPVFVTGATGMVGSWLVKELLSRGANVIALVRDADPRSELFRSGDVRRLNVVSGCLEDFWTLERALNEYDVETVFHLGASPIVGVAHRFPLPTLETNIRGTYNLLEACRIHQTFVKRIVIASSDKAYGAQPLLPYTEDMPLLGRHPYEVSKSCADLLAQAYAHTYGLPVAIARCGNIYGGGDLNWSRIVPGTIRSLFFGERPIIRSDGTYVRDYLYVQDVVAAYLALAEHLDDASVRGEAFNFSPGSPHTVREVVQVIQRLMGAEHLAPDIQNVAQGEIHSQALSSVKARTILGWSPRYTLEEGLKETIAWYRTFLAHAEEPAWASLRTQAVAHPDHP
ncbi:MAG: GDP-mannose 4,6-dehydratase [bacterium]|nr:GDP-mannose 4,6-dehydratase [bacterium]